MILHAPSQTCSKYPFCGTYDQNHDRYEKIADKKSNAEIGHVNLLSWKTETEANEGNRSLSRITGHFQYRKKALQ